MKLAREHINEKFTEDSDPIKDLRIGMEKFKDEYEDYLLLKILNGLKYEDRIKFVENEFSLSIDELYYLGDTESYKAFKSSQINYFNKLEKLINSGNKIYDGVKTSSCDENTELFKVYETEFGKIGTFYYFKYDKTYQYFGELSVAVSLKTKQNFRM